MSSTITMTTPPPDHESLGGLVQKWGPYLWTLLVTGGLGGWLIRQFTSWRSRRAHRAELFEAMAEAASLAADMERFRFEYTPLMTQFEDYLDTEAFAHWRSRGEHGLTPREQWEKLKDRTRESRKRIWEARGFPEAPEDPESRAKHAERLRVARALKQTGRWRAHDSGVWPAIKDHDGGHGA